MVTLLPCNNVTHFEHHYSKASRMILLCSKNREAGREGGREGGDLKLSVTSYGPNLLSS